MSKLSVFFERGRGDFSIFFYLLVIGFLGLVGWIFLIEFGFLGLNFLLIGSDFF